MKTALVVSGGGSKGAFAVGAIEILKKKKYDFDFVAGTSTGALIAPLVSIGDISKLAEIYTSVENRDILRYNWRRLFKDSIYDTKPLEKLIRKVMFECVDLDTTRYDLLMRSKVKVLLCAVSLQTRQVCYFSQSDNGDKIKSWKTHNEFVQSILSSTNQPFLMPPIDLHDNQWVDGGVREIAPIDIVVEHGASRVIAIVNTPEKEEESDKRYTNILSIGARALSLMSDEVVLNDVRMVKKYNQFLEYISNIKSKVSSRFNDIELDHIFNHELLQNKKPLELIVIRPEVELPSDGLEFDPKTMQKMRLLGQQAAKKAINESV